MPALPFAAPQGTRICRIWNSTSDHAANFHPWACQRASDWALEAASYEVFGVAPFSTPFSGLCPRLRSLCKGRPDDGTRRFPEWSPPFDIPPHSLATVRKSMRLSRSVPSRRTMPTHPPVPAPLYAAQAHPARRSGRKATGSVRHPIASPVSPEGDHFPQTRCMGFCVFSPRPRRPRLAATPCSVSAAEWDDCRHRFARGGKCGAKTGMAGSVSCGYGSPGHARK
jgi:hypothetical protein